MRGLTPAERAELAACAATVVEWFQSGDPCHDTLLELAARGLVVRVDALDEEHGAHWEWLPTDLGRLALRVSGGWR